MELADQTSAGYKAHKVALIESMAIGCRADSTKGKAYATLTRHEPWYQIVDTARELHITLSLSLVATKC